MSATVWSVALTSQHHLLPHPPGKATDTLSGGANNDLLTGNGGKDLFIYSSGNDTITDYVSNQDLIQIAGTKYTSYVVEGKDVILSFSNGGSIRVVNGKNKMLSFEASGGGQAPSSTIYSDYYEKVFSSKTSTNLYFADTTVVTINATSNGKAIDITGNSKDNVIKGSAKNDTLRGGAGSDTLTGNAGADTFIYSSGNDIITDYNPSQKDKIKIENASFRLTNYSVDGNDIVFNINSSNSLRVTNGKGKKLTITDYSGETTTETYGGSNYEERFYESIDLFKDDNFNLSSDLSSILEPSTSLAAFEDVTPYQITPNPTSKDPLPISKRTPLPLPQKKNAD